MENTRRWQAPYGTRMRRITTFVIGVWVRHYISTTRIDVKLDYISRWMPYTACLRKSLLAEIFGPKADKVGYFKIFFSFSNITLEIFILEENFCLQNSRAHQAAFFHFSECLCDSFHPSYCEKNRLKWANLHIIRDSCL